MQLRQRGLFGPADRRAPEGGRQGTGDDRARTGQPAAHRLDIAGQVFEGILQRQKAAHRACGGQDVVRFGRVFGEIDRHVHIEAADAGPVR